MPAYEIYFHCNDCKRDHPIHLKIHLDHGPDSKQSLTDFFRERLMPPQVTAIQGRIALCLRTGKTFRLDKNDQIFLVPPTVTLTPDE